jgi:hypothetical protein
MKKVSVTDYAKYREISRQAVLKRLHPVIKEMPFVVSAEKIGNTWF